MTGLTSSVDENSTAALTSPRTLTSMDEKNADCHCQANDVVCSTTCHACHHYHHQQHHHQPLPINSATTFLFKKAASMIWRLVKEIDWDESARTLAELHALVSSAISLHFYSLVQALHVISDFGVDCSYFDTTCAHDGGEASPRRVTPALSSCEPTTVDFRVAGSLTCQQSDLSTNDSNRSLDQSDVSRAVKAAYCCSSNILPELRTSTIQQDDESLNENSTVCSSCHDDEEAVEDFLLRNADIIEDYIANSENSSEEAGGGGISQLVTGDLPQFSWMIVPNDLNEELKRQLSRSSIDTDEYESKHCCHTPNTIDDGVICQVPSQDDDDEGGEEDQLRELLYQQDIELNMPPSQQEEAEAKDNDDVLQANPSTSPSPPHSSSSSTFQRLGHILSGLGH